MSDMTSSSTPSAESELNQLLANFHIDVPEHPDKAVYLSPVMIDKLKAVILPHLEAAVRSARIDELRNAMIEAYHSPLESPETNYDKCIKNRLKVLKNE